MSHQSIPALWALPTLWGCRLWGVIGLLVLALGLNSACGDKGTKRPSDQADLVFSVGRGPRVALRYAFRRGLVLHYRLRSVRSLVGAPDPEERQIRHLTLAVDRVRGARAQVRWRVEPGLGVGTDASGRALWLQLTDRGAVEAQAPGRGQGELDAWLGAALRSAFARFPAEALGAGARWRETRKQELRPKPELPAVETRLVADYTLERFTPCGSTRCAEISIHSRVSLAHRLGARRLVGEGAGRGQLIFDLGRGVLVSSSSSSEVEIRVLGPLGQVKETFRLRQELEEIRVPLGQGASGTRPTPAPGGRPTAPESGPPVAPPAR